VAVGFSALRLIVAVIAMVLAGTSMTWIAKRQIGGQTGDIAGACQQLAEIAFLCVMANHAGL
jgi:adenosylcobinamide-GDP ribazoletransferase